MPNAEMKRNIRDTSDRYPLSKARREVQYLIGKDRTRRRCPATYGRGIGTTAPSFEQASRTVEDVNERRRNVKGDSKCWVTEPKCRAGCDCRNELYRGPEGLGAYHRLVTKAAFHSSPALIQTLLYPHLTSNFVKSVAPRSLSTISAISGSG
ncbi:hypothetical protein IEO21_11039 [Rhodonia placenta]|uniref:Uncharacterized protein n=1 Tax=Rhodonia placenta TaxID=104341 RepID=A0A8H7NRB9_9APHY|nr:hypothetical protein IEO21_11039 [Postia placenta]